MKRSVLLACLWCACTAVNLTKSVHIDDTAHLEIAEAILADPWHPMTLQVHWNRGMGPIHLLNQPHLFFYLLALVMLPPGPTVLWAHVLLSLFTLAAIAVFHGLLRRAGVNQGNAGACTAMMFLGPAFLPSQNLMVDVPLLALWVAFFGVLSAGQPDAGRDVRAGVLAGLSCLVKYTSVVLVALLALDVVRDRRRWLALLPALAILAAWSAFNLHDYGGVHLIERKVENAGLGPGAAAGAVAARALIWVVGLGGIAPFTVAFHRRARARWLTGRVWMGAAAFVVAFAVGGQLASSHGVGPFQPESVVVSVLRPVFFCNGVLVLALATSAARRGLGKGRGFGAQREAVWRAASWIAATTAFIVVLSPFVAVRHLLLCLPAFFVLLALDDEQRPSAGDWRLGVGLSAVLGLLVAVADFRHADVYRSHTRELAGQFQERRVLFTGHWGLQWYAKQVGFEHYEPGVTSMHAGDLLVVPTVVQHPPIAESEAARLTLLRTDVIEGGTLDVFRPMTELGGFYSLWQGLPWTLTGQPLEVFRLYEAR